MSNLPKPEEVQSTLFKNNEFRQLFALWHEIVLKQWQAFLSLEIQFVSFLFRYSIKTLLADLKAIFVLLQYECPSNFINSLLIMRQTFSKLSRQFNSFQLSN